MGRPSYAPAALPAALALLGLGACGDARPDDRIRDIPPPPIAELVPAAQALQGANVPTLDPAPMDDAEIRKVIGPGPRCAFQYARSGKPVVAFQATRPGAPTSGVVKLNGKLISLSLQASATGPSRNLRAEGLLLRIAPETEPQMRPGEEPELVEAKMIFNVRQADGLEVGYGGYYGCARSPDRTPGVAD